MTDPEPKEQSETPFQGVLTHNVNRADQQGVHMTNSTVNDARVRQEITGLEITNNPTVAALALVDEAGVLVAAEAEVAAAEADEGKRKKIKKIKKLINRKRRHKNEQECFSLSSHSHGLSCFVWLRE